MFLIIFFAKQCSLIQAVVSCLRKYHTWQRTVFILSVLIKAVLTTIIKASGKSKVHGQDGISVKVVKVCTDSLAQSLAFIFQNALALGIFTYDWEKQTLLQFIKNQKQIVLHCRPVSVLPVFSKTFEKKKQSLTEDIFLSFDSSLSLKAVEYS